MIKRSHQNMTLLRHIILWHAILGGCRKWDPSPISWSQWEAPQDGWLILKSHHSSAVQCVDTVWGDRSRKWREVCDSHRIWLPGHISCQSGHESTITEGKSQRLDLYDYSAWVVNMTGPKTGDALYGAYKSAQQHSQEEKSGGVDQVYWVMLLGIASFSASTTTRQAGR